MALLSACSADTAPADLRTIARTDAPNDALACPPGRCRAAADIESPAFSLGTEDLLRLAETVFGAEPRTGLAGRDAALGQLVFVQRSRLFGFPDTVRVQAVALDPGASVILYSRSNIGYWDLGANRARGRDWLAKLRAAAPSAAP